MNTRNSPAPRQFRWLPVALAALLATGLTLAGCAAPATAPESTDTDRSPGVEEALAAHDLAGLDVREVIERLDAMPVADRPTDLVASVQPEALVLRAADDREVRLPMPDDEVYVSVAPFREQTHECHFHSLTTCIGELTDTEVHLTLTTDDSAVLIDEMRRTYDNGFVGFWVPRGITATLTITHDGRSGSVPVSTRNADDRTCITDLQLL
ncbi:MULTISPECIES: CueP family metal-binding protein [unclassified Microbacterium]|uniref:CueP family metal-binding protein n=1 Tax=unclassified Microbacterium TaxID=2609290 RepID=UPI00301589BF